LFRVPPETQPAVPGETQTPIFRRTRREKLFETRFGVPSAICACPSETNRAGEKNHCPAHPFGGGLRARGACDTDRRPQRVDEVNGSKINFPNASEMVGFRDERNLMLERILRFRCAQLTPPGPCTSLMSPWSGGLGPGRRCGAAAYATRRGVCAGRIPSRPSDPCRAEATCRARGPPSHRRGRR
jgi:hypothetical protein